MENKALSLNWKLYNAGDVIPYMTHISRCIIRKDSLFLVQINELNTRQDILNYMPLNNIFKIFCVLQKKIIQVWNNRRVSELCKN